MFYIGFFCLSSPSLLAVAFSTSESLRSRSGKPIDTRERNSGRGRIEVAAGVGK